jgi:hypothetical protein
MFPSQNPKVYVLLLLAVFVLIAGAIAAGVVLQQPLALLALLGLRFLPELGEIPLVPQGASGADSDEEAAEAQYEGSEAFGFIAKSDAGA